MLRYEAFKLLRHCLACNYRVLRVLSSALFLGSASGHQRGVGPRRTPWLGGGERGVGEVVVPQRNRM